LHYLLVEKGGFLASTILVALVILVAVVDVALYLEYSRLKERVAKSYFRAAVGSTPGTAASLLSLKAQALGGPGASNLYFETPKAMEQAASQARAGEEVVSLRREFEELKRRIVRELDPVEGYAGRMQRNVENLLVFKKNAALDLAAMKTDLEGLRAAIRDLQSKESKKSPYVERLGEVEKQVDDLLAKTRKAYDALYA